MRDILKCWCCQVGDLLFRLCPFWGGGWGAEGLILPEFDEPELEPETKLFFSKLIQYQLLFLLKKSYWLYYMAEAHLTELINNSV